MTIDVDEPGRRLVLSDRTAVVPKAAVRIIGGLIVALFSVPAIQSAMALARSGERTDGLGDLAVVSLAPVLALAFLTTVVRSQRCIGRLAVDRAAQRIEVTEMRILGGRSIAPESFPLADVRGLNVRVLRQALRDSRASSRAPLALVAKAVFRSSQASLVHRVKVVFREDCGRKPRQLAFAVEGVDRVEEGIDLALRIASAAGFEAHTLVRNDAQGAELDFGNAPGFAPVAEAAGKADYAQDQVQDAARALAGHTLTPSFDPASFAGDHVISVWQPGVEVRFRRPMGLAAIGCAPGVLTLLGGPLLLVLAFLGPSSLFVDRLVTAAFLLVVGLTIGTFASFIVWSSSPRTVTFDWTERRLRIRTLVFEQAYDFSTLQCLELERVRVRRFNDYWSNIHAQIAPPGGKPKRIELLSTTVSHDDPGTPYGLGLSLLTDLARSIGTKQVVTDRNARS